LINPPLIQKPFLAPGTKPNDGASGAGAGEPPPTLPEAPPMISTQPQAIVDTQTQQENKNSPSSPQRTATYNQGVTDTILQDNTLPDNTQRTPANVSTTDFIQEQRLGISQGIKDCLKNDQVLEKLGEDRQEENLSKRSPKNYFKIIDCYQQGLIFARKLGDNQSQQQALYNLGIAYFSLGEYGKASEYYEKHLDVAKKLGDSFGQGQALGGLAATYSALGNYEKAIDYYQKSLNIARGVSNPKWQGTTLRNLGIAYLSQGDYTQAIKYQEQSLAIAKSIQDRQGEGQALGNLGIAYFSQGNYPKAIYYQEQHLRLARQLQDRAGEGRALGNLGLAYYG
ncbi:MAG: tetratricopeptide repeat protein, partial [Cyanobacteriota bacterium]